MRRAFGWGLSVAAATLELACGGNTTGGEAQDGGGGTGGTATGGSSGLGGFGGTPTGGSGGLGETCSRRTNGPPAGGTSVAVLAVQRLDMKDGSNGDPGQECNGISIGLGFESVAASIGGVAAPVQPTKDPCAPQLGCWFGAESPDWLIVGHE